MSKEMSIAERVAKSRAEQGLPPTIEDPAILMRIAHLIAEGYARQQGRPEPIPRPEVTDDFVYFIRSETGYIKIGRSRDPELRMKSLATNVPGLELLATLPNGNLETDFHRRFAAYRSHGEWFRPGPLLLAFLEELKWKEAAK